MAEEMSKASKRYDKGGKEGPTGGSKTPVKETPHSEEASGAREESKEPAKPEHHERHMAERKEMRTRHEKEHRDMHGQHRDAMRDMHARQESEMTAMNARQDQDMQAAPEGAPAGGAGELGSSPPGNTPQPAPQMEEPAAA